VILIRRGETMYTTFISCKECGVVFEVNIDDIGNPVQEICNGCWAEQECVNCEDKNCEECDI